MKNETKHVELEQFLHPFVSCGEKKAIAHQQWSCHMLVINLLLHLPTTSTCRVYRIHKQSGSISVIFKIFYNSGL